MIHPLPILAQLMERRLELARLPQGWSAVVALALLIVLLYMTTLFYRRERRASASRRVRLTLATVRCAVLLLLAIVALQPVLATYLHHEQKAATLVLIDNSASMSLRDHYSDPVERQKVLASLGEHHADEIGKITRVELIHTLLNDDGQDNLLSQMTANNPVYVYTFGDSLQAIGQVSDNQPPKPDKAAADPTPQFDASATRPAMMVEANAPATDIGRAVRQAIEMQGNAPIAAVAVLSDGRFNRGEPPDVVGRYAASRKIPVFCVGIGDPSPPRNLAVIGVEAPPNVFVKDAFKINAQLRVQESAGKTIDVELLQRTGGDDSWAPQKTRQVNIPEGAGTVSVTFEHQIGQAAEVRLMVRVLPREGETILEDNHREITVRALENKMRVLLVAGAPSWEYRLLSRLLERDATVTVSCWLQSADETAVRDGNEVIDHFPREREELIAYDAIILLDPQSGDIDPAWSSIVESMVTTTGGGLLYVAGRKNTPRLAHDTHARELFALLPVITDAGEADLLINEMGYFQTTAWPLVVPPEALGHPVLAMSEQADENARIWAELPGVYWHYPVRREKPVATVLMRHSNPRMRNTFGGHVLLATQFLGSGRTAYLAFDTTWRWRRYGEQYFNRFWIQLLRHLVEGKLLSGQKRGLIQMDKDYYEVGEPMTIEARLMDPRHLPLEAEQVELTVRMDEEVLSMISMQSQPNRPGWYRGQFVHTRTGTHTLQIDLPGEAGTEAAVIRGEVRVAQADLEFRQTELDRASLRRLAESSAGGLYLDIDQVGQLVTLIPDKTTRMIVTGQPFSLWDRWWTLAVLIALLGFEWGLRKRTGLL